MKKKLRTYIDFPQGSLADIDIFGGGNVGKCNDVVRWVCEYSYLSYNGKLPPRQGTIFTSLHTYI